MNLLKHENNTDVAIEVLKKWWIPQKQKWKIKARWWNITGTPHIMPVGREGVWSFYIDTKNFNRFKPWRTDG